MDFRISEEQELLLESLRELVARECSADYIRECTEKHVGPERLDKALLEAGFCHLGLPEEYGGTPVDTVTLALYTEELARLTGASLPGVTNALSVDDILTFGSAEQQQTILGLYTETGACPFALGISEPQAGSDNSALSTSATHKDGKVYINGGKTFTTNAMESSYLLCMARDDDAEDPRRAISMYLIPMDAPGVTRSKLHKIGQKMATCCEIYLDNVELEESALVGVKGNGFAQLMKNFEVERLLIAAKCLGQAEAAFEDAAQHANQRVQFGKPIGTFQLIQEKLVDMKVRVENMRSMVYKTAWKKDNGISISADASMAKYYCAQAAFEVADDAMQIIGGIGVTEDHRISRIWGDCRISRIAGGTDQIMVRVVSKQIFKDFAADAR